MSDILKEVDDALRRERMEKMWKEYGHFVLGFILFVILATAVYSGWSAWNESVQSKQTEQLMALLEDPKFPANVNPDELHMRAPLRGIALMNAAGAYAQQNKNTEALKLFKAAADDHAIPPDLRQLAILMQARLLSADAASQENLVELLKPVMNDRKSAWQPYALLEAAAFAAERNKDYTASREYLKEVLETKELPQSIYGKARSLDQIYSAKQEQTQKTDQKT